MKHDFTKKMRNVHTGEHQEREPKQRLPRDLSITVEIDPSEKMRYQGFMKQELSYYNSLINAFTARTRTFPEHILALNEQWVKLFGQIAYEGKSIKHLEKSDETTELSEALEPFRKYLLGYDHEGNRILTERMATIMEAAAAPGVLHPVVRRNMALEIIRHYKEQAQKFITPAYQNADGDLYRSTPEMLETPDMLKKRHVQMPRAMVKVEWDEKAEQSRIYSAYCARPIVVPNINLAQNADWSMLILHQEPNVVARPQSPWVLDIKTTPASYLIKYMDVHNPKTGQTFAIAKKRDFS